MTTKLQEGQTPIVGKYYRVPCAILDIGNGRTLAVPVIGPPHKDKQFAFRYSHYHIDGRFAGKEVERHYYMDDGRTNFIICTEKQIDNDYASRHKFLRTELRRRKCKRLNTGLILPQKFTDKKYSDWAISMIGKSCKGKKCPHLGYPMQEIEGQLVCPLHDLRGDMDTEKIILHPKIR